MTFVECGRDLAPALQMFFRDVYRRESPLSSNQAFFDWQFRPRANGTPATHPCKIALLDEEIVGSLGYVPVEVSVGTSRLRGAWTANWIVHEKYRGFGAGPLLMRELIRQFDLTLVVGVSREARAVLPRMGFIDYGDLTRYIRVIDPDSAALLTEDGNLDWPLDARLRHSPGAATVSVTAVRGFDDEATELWDSLLGSTGAGTRRSAEFLNWRYAAHPVFEYQLFEARCERQLLGIAVYRVEAVQGTDVRVGRILELIGDSSAQGALVDALVEHATDGDVALMDFFCSRRDVHALTDRGFVHGEPAGGRVPMLFQPIDRRRTGIPFMAHLAKLPKPFEAQWYVTKGDGDQDRPN